jgi:hypothetical protein
MADGKVGSSGSLDQCNKRKSAKAAACSKSFYLLAISLYGGRYPGYISFIPVVQPGMGVDGLDLLWTTEDGGGGKENKTHICD